MAVPAISVRGLGKRYRLGKSRSHDTLRDQITHGARSLLHRWTRPAAVNGNEDDAETLWALKDISFDVQEGEVMGVIGRNGAGKSTLLKILSQITEPTTGEIRVRGRIASLLEVGTGFHQELTGRENIYLNGAILGMTRAEIRRKFDEIVAFSEVERFLDTPVKRYSSGMYMRLAFAVAAHLDPEILIVDEVLAVGDVDFQKKCLGKMQAVSRGGRTVFFVSHNLAAVQKLCTRTLAIKAGRVVADGPPDEVVKFYLGEGMAHTGGFAALDGAGISRRGNGRAQFAYLKLLNERGAQTGEFLFGEPFTVEIALDSSIRRDRVTVGFSFISSDGVELMGSCAHDGGVVVNLEPGRSTLRCAVDPNLLVPGKYFIRAAIFQAAELFDHIDEIVFFEVTPAVASVEGTPASHYVGHLFIPYRWEKVE